MNQNLTSLTFAAACRDHQAGQVEKAIAGYQDVLQMQPQHPHALHLLGTLYRQQGYPTRAIALIQQAIDQNPHVPTFYFGLGQAHLDRGDYAIAVECFEQAIAREPYFADAHFQIGIACQAKGDLSLAMVHFQSAWRLQPNLLAACGKWAEVLLQRGEEQEAIALLSRGLQKNPREAFLLEILGKAWVQAGNDRKAIACVRQALVLSPDNVALAAELGRILNCLGETNHPDYAQSQIDLGKFSLLSGEWDEAKKAFARAVESRPRWAIAHQYQADGDLRLGDLAAAARHLENAIALEPRVPEFRLALRNLHLSTGDWQKAFDIHRQIPSRAHWKGEDLSEKALFISTKTEEDALLIFSLLPLVSAANIYWDCPYPLHALFAPTMAAHVTLISPGDRAPVASYTADLVDLLAVLSLSPDALPQASLSPPEVTERLIIKQAKKGPKRKIGLIWSPETGQGIPLLECLPLIEDVSAQWISLQRGSAIDELERSDWGERLKDYGSQMSSYSDALILISQLDQLVTANPIYAQLAGLLGKTTHLLLPSSHQWSWMRDRADSPWYPSVTLWRGPVSELVAALQK